MIVVVSSSCRGGVDGLRSTKTQSCFVQINWIPGRRSSVPSHCRSWAINSAAR